MPHTSRSQRRRQPARTQQRRAAERSSTEEGVAMRPPTTRAAGRRLLVEPVDYSQDYAYVRQDLVRIALWGGLLLIAIFGFYFYRLFT